MTTTYQLHTSELSAELINSIKAVFNDKSIQISVAEINSSNEQENQEENPNWKDNIDFWMGGDSEPSYQKF